MLTALIDFIFPRHCRVCGKRLTPCEGRYADYLDGIWNLDSDKRRTTEEGPYANFRNGIWNLDSDK